MALPKREDEEGGTVGEAPPVLEDTVLADKPPLTVDLNAAEDEEPATAPPEQREAGRRHKSDWKRMKESYDQRFAEQEKRYTDLQRELQEMRRQPGTQQQQGAAAPKDEADPRRTEARSVRQQQQALLNMIPHATSEEEKNKLIEQYHDLDEKRIALISAANAPKPQQLNPDQIAYHTLAMEFPDIYADPDLRMEADVEMRKLMKRYHKPYNIATAREALDRVMRANNLGGNRRPPAPTDTERARFSAVSARGAAGGSSGGAYQPSKFQMNLARAFTAHMPDLSDQERFIHWMKATKAKESGLL